MPSPPVAPNVLRVRFGFTVGEDVNALSALHFKWSGTAPTAAACAAIASDMQGDFATFAEPLMDESTKLTSTIVQDLTSSTGAEGEFTGTDAGTRSGDELPAEAAALWNHRISRRYRGGKPRSYWPFGVESDLEDRQTWASAFVSAVETGWGTFLTNVAGRPSHDGVVVGALCSLSIYEGFTVVTNPITGRARNVPTYRSSAIIDPIVSGSLNIRVGSQRRRQLHSA